VAGAVDAGALPLVTLDRDQRRYGIVTEEP
jgi:hypothetical protein